MNINTTPIQKAAILATSLDRETARALLGQLDETQQKRLHAAIAELGEVAPAVRQAVIDEFFRIGPMTPPQPAGVELGASLGRTVSPPRKETAATTVDRDGLTAAAPDFRCLAGTETERLSQFLQGEHPQTIAVVLSHIPSSRAADVVATLSSDVQADVLRRLAELDETPVDILREVERGLEARIAQYTQHQQRRAAGVQAVANILQAADGGTKREIMANLEAHSPRLASSLDLPRFTFAQFENLDTLTIAKVFQAADTDLTMLALAGASRAFVDQVVAQLPARESRRLQRALEQLGPTSLADVEHAQREIVRVAEQLDVAGRIRLPRAGLLNAAA